jgi:prolyl oligopeptidase
LYVSSLENLQSKITVYRFDDATNVFVLEGAYEAENCQTFSVGGAEPNSSNALFCSSSGFLNPSTYLYSEEGGLKGIQNAQSLKSNTSWFDTEGMSVTLNEATSKDGTKVPYFLVRAKGNDENSGPKPTVLNGYGGFEITSLPSYSGSTGKAFLNHGMNFALACIRGGGEFGPEWSYCAKKENRWKSFEDFNAVAEDLVKIGATTPQQLGCIGGSNGGLLTGAMATHFPESFGAIVSQCPLLDMERYVYLTSGSSWINEYGDPRIESLKPKILAWSPYHQISEHSVAKMPPTLFTCSTADDRVHPSHARRFVEKAHKVAKDEVKAKDTILYHEMTEGGHAGAADNKNRAKIKTIEYTFLRTKLCNAQP